MGEAVRGGLTGTLDPALLNEQLAGLEASFELLPELESMGVPEQGASAYQELTTAAWVINDHLAEVGFFASAEENLPAFEPDHIEATTRQLLHMDTLPATLSEIGFSEQEQTALVTNIVNTREQLSWWLATPDYPPADAVEDGVVHEYVAPLHQRAAEGSLLDRRARSLPLAARAAHYRGDDRSRPLGHQVDARRVLPDEFGCT